MPGGQAIAYEAGNNLLFEFAGAVDGQQYYFSVAAYAPGHEVGARTVEISRYPNSAPALTNPGPLTSTAGTGLTLQLTGNDSDGGGLTFNALNLPLGLSVASNGTISGTPTTAGPYVVTATVTDGQLTDTETFVWTIAAAAQDVTPPAVVIAVPNAAPNAPAPIVLNPAPAAPANPGNPAAAGPANPGDPVATGPVQTGPATPPAVVPPVVIPPGAQPVAAAGVVPQPAPGVSTNRFARWRDAERNTPAKDANTERPVLARGPRPSAPAPAQDDTNAGTTLAERLRARVQAARNTPSAPVPTVHDAAAPLTVTATTEAARNTSWGGRAKPATTVTDQPFITLAGSAADDRGIRSVEWVTDRGLNGTATGTDTWIAAVPLLPGLNRITVKVRDGAGNLSSSVVPVQYNERPTLKK
jgi:hypothetical protein